MAGPFFPFEDEARGVHPENEDQEKRKPAQEERSGDSPARHGPDLDRIGDGQIPRTDVPDDVRAPFQKVFGQQEACQEGRVDEGRRQGKRPADQKRPQTDQCRGGEQGGKDTPDRVAPVDP